MDLLHRIRWTNVARAAAVLGTVALVAAWPRLRAAPPALPATDSAPVSPEIVAGVVVPVSNFVTVFPPVATKAGGSAASAAAGAPNTMTDAATDAARDLRLKRAHSFRAPLPPSAARGCVASCLSKVHNPRGA